MKEPVFYVIDETHLEDLKFVAKRLRNFATQMSPEEMREASFRVMSVVRYTETIQALRGPGELYVHLFPHESPPEKK